MPHVAGGAGRRPRPAAGRGPARDSRWRRGRSGRRGRGCGRSRRLSPLPRGGAAARNLASGSVAGSCGHLPRGRHPRVGASVPVFTACDARMMHGAYLDRSGPSATPTSTTDLEWLHALVSDWQLLADLSFADLVLWVPRATRARRDPGRPAESLRRRRCGRPPARPPTPTTSSARSCQDGQRGADRRGLAGAAHRPGGRPRVGQRRPGPGGVDPGAARRPRSSG